MRVRLDAKWWLDERESTLARYPNPNPYKALPELQLWLSYEARL